MILTKSDSSSASLVKEQLLAGKVVIIPTDTVYGFSGIVDKKNTGTKTQPFFTDNAIRQIKGRDEKKPLIQLIAEPTDIKLYTDDFIPEAVISKWPGSLTVIVNVKKENPLYAPFTTIAFRCPGDEWLRKIIASVNAPIFSTSVNRSGNPVLDSESEIVREFEKEVPLIVLDGDKKNALPSTLIRLDEKGNPVVLRQGSVHL